MPTINRIIDIAEGPAYLRYENKLLVVERKEAENVTIPVSDIAVLVLSSPYITFTQPIIAELSQAGVCTIFSDHTCMPVAMCLPLGVHHQPATRFRLQADASKPLIKQLWKEIIQSKLCHQAELLRYLHHDTFRLDKFAESVRSGDPDNFEAQGAKIYWSHLFTENTFTRNRDEHNANLLFNYGYTILRAITARAICASGLHPGLGIHHHHRDNSFCLADDLMEPFRVYVDHAVYILLSGNNEPYIELTKKSKAQIIGALLRPISIDDHNETLFYVIQRLVGSLVHSFETRIPELRIPLPCFK